MFSALGGEDGSQAIPRGFADDVSDAAEVVGTALRLDRSNVTTHAPLAARAARATAPVEGLQTRASPASMPVEDGIMTLGEQLITAPRERQKWDVKAQKQAWQLFAHNERASKLDSE
jgi:hypothetical protein